ncbi:aldehyde ferredoxin oxidoreductase family protein [Candidatus Aerophobetes bacterium]|nr:aldehyde ferredoxin oxidoreductase family protein [Candidatus Aerophobetes bacterium]
MKGWMGKIAAVDLSSGSITEEKINSEIREKYLGGRGFGVSIMYSKIGPEVAPLSPENLLIFTTGPLTGTKAPTSSRISLSTKSPLTGTIFDSNAGGRWGIQLKKAGYDALIIKGKASSPIFIDVNEKEIQIKDAKNLWGKETFESIKLLKKIKKNKVSVVSIGPAGENLVRFASIMVDEYGTFGRGGVGAVMGSKNLKAICVSGKRKVEIADSEQLDFVIYETKKWIKANPLTSIGLPEFGTPVLVNLVNKKGLFPVKNCQTSYIKEIENLSGEKIKEKIFVKRTACPTCPIGCRRITQTKNERGKGPEFETVYSLGAMCYIFDLEIVAEANYLCNRLGLDTISTGVTIACAMELKQRGVVDAGISFGEKDKLKEIIKNIAYRRGIGNDLAEGSYLFALKYKAENYAMQVKGLEFPAYDPRGMKGMGLAYATSNRGACHLRAYMVGPEVLGIPKLINRFATTGKSGLLIYIQNLNAALDTLIFCRFGGFAISDDYYARLVSAVTGWQIEPHNLQIIGERIWNLERLYNLREGFSRKDDLLPSRMLKEPLPKGPSKGETIDLNGMLDEYYNCRGWNKKGIPDKIKLKTLGLNSSKEEKIA